MHFRRISWNNHEDFNIWGQICHLVWSQDVESNQPSSVVIIFWLWFITLHLLLYYFPIHVKTRFYVKTTFCMYLEVFNNQMSRGIRFEHNTGLLMSRSVIQWCDSVTPHGLHLLSPIVFGSSRFDHFYPNKAKSNRATGILNRGKGRAFGTRLRLCPSVQRGVTYLHSLYLISYRLMTIWKWKNPCPSWF